MAKTKFGHILHRGAHKIKKEIKHDANKVKKRFKKAGNELESDWKRIGNKIDKGLEKSGVNNLARNIVGYAKLAAKHPKKFEKDLVDKGTHPVRTLEGAVQHAIKRGIRGEPIADDRYNMKSKGNKSLMKGKSEKEKKLIRKAYKSGKQAKKERTPWSEKGQKILRSRVK